MIFRTPFSTGLLQCLLIRYAPPLSCIIVYSSLFHLPTHLLLLHVNNTTDAVTRLHVGESLVDLRQRLTVSNELVDLELAVHVIVNKVRQLSAALDTTEGATLPYTASNELECCDLLEPDRPVHQ